MAITFVGFGTDEGASVTSVTPPLPGGHQLDDIMIGTCQRERTSGSEAWSAPAGWTQIEEQLETGGRDRRIGVFWKRHDGSESNPTFNTNKPTGEPSSGMVSLFRGVDTVTAFDVTYVKATHYQAGINDANPPNQAITTVTDNAWILLIHLCTENDITADGPPTGYTIRGTLTGASFQHRQQQMASNQKVTAGAESPGDWLNTASPTDVQEWVTITLALRPAAAPGGPAAGSLALMGVGK